MERPIKIPINSKPARKLAKDLRCSLAEAAEALEALIALRREEDEDQWRND